jgi:GNAT superfamily N-acetyltransferase
MNTERLTNEKEQLEAYSFVLTSLREDEHKNRLILEEFKHNINSRNPFTIHGSHTSIVVKKNGIPVSHACVVYDSRIPEVACVGYVLYPNEYRVFQLLMDEVVVYLREHAVFKVRGPINFNTWQDFRLCTGGDEGEQQVFLEPFNDMYLNEVWKRYGFISCATYVSKKATAEMFGKYLTQDSRSDNQDFIYKKITSKEAIDESVNLHKVAIDVFNKTEGFTPITLEEFRYIYQKPLTDSKTFGIFVAKKKGVVIGFLVCSYNIFNNLKKSYIFKSIAVHSKYRNLGVARGLFKVAHEYAKENGIEDYYFLTMHTDNKKIHAIVGDQKIFRKYEVYELNI